MSYITSPLVPRADRGVNSIFGHYLLVGVTAAIDWFFECAEQAGINFIAQLAGQVHETEALIVDGSHGSETCQGVVQSGEV